MENINFSPFIGTTIRLLFLFSTIYTLAFFYNSGLNVSGLDDAKTPSDIKISSTGVFGFVLNTLDGILEIISLFSPLTLIKPLFLLITQDTPFLRTLIDMLIWRPVSIAVSLITINFIISKIPTVSGESG